MRIFGMERYGEESYETFQSFHNIGQLKMGVGTAMYGHAKKQELSGNERIEAEAGGYLPCSYQVIKWFVILWLPVIPLGTYRVMREKQGFWTLEFSHYKIWPVNWDWAQVLRHYLIAYGWAILLFLVGVTADTISRIGHTP
jgi:hypothetical protein